MTQTHQKPHMFSYRIILELFRFSLSKFQKEQKIAAEKLCNINKIGANMKNIHITDINTKFRDLSNSVSIQIMHRNLIKIKRLIEINTAFI